MVIVVIIDDVLRKKINDIFYDNDSKNIFLYVLINKEFEEVLSSLLNDDVTTFLHTLTKEDELIIEKIKQENDSFKKYELVVFLEFTFGLIETITEKSRFSDKIAQEFKNRYGSNYLDVLKDIDQKKKDNDELINKYLLIKEWQDKQNKLGHEVIGPLLDNVEYFFDNVNNYIFFKLREKKIWDMSLVSYLLDLLTKEQLLSLVGGKAYGLAKLYKYHLVIPNTYVIPTEVVMESEDWNYFDDDKRYAVRSSATIEDGEKHSFAGMFESYLDVNKDELDDKFTLVKKSIESKRVKCYLEDNNLGNLEMAVIIQEFKKVDYAGVWFGTTLDAGIYEYIADIGEKLVSGEVQATRIQFHDGDDIRLDNINIGQYFIKVQHILGEICDLEWCIIDRNLILLQYRSVTRKVNIKTESKKKERNTILALGVAPGEVTGNVCYLSTYQKHNEFKEGDILITNKTDVMWISEIKKAKALVTKTGSLLCHAAIIARELGIPCVTDIDDEDFTKISKAKTIYLNGSTGEIKIIK